MNFSKMYKWLYPILCTMFFQISFAQQAVVADKEEIFKGVITNGKNIPVQGVEVSVQEQTSGTLTNAKGEFSIQATLKDILLFKKDGYMILQKFLSSNNLILIKLESAGIDAGEEDNVYIPFGIRKKKQVSAAITTIKSNAVSQAPLGDVKNLFSGRVSGLYLPQAGSSPGSDGTSLYIRGRNSFDTKSAKAYVDGVQREFGDMDLNEIESVTLLKDAASLAWYGLRGGNGIILINTKKGSPAKSYINVDIQTGYQTPVNMIKPLNSFNFAQLYNEASINDGNPIAPYNQVALDAYQHGTDPYIYPDNNYTRDYLKKSSSIQRYVMSTGGGSNTVRYFALLSYYDQGGLLKNTNAPSFNSNTGYEKFNFRGNVDFDVNKYLTLTLNTGMRTEKRLNPGSGLSNVLSALYDTPPNAFPILNRDNTLGGTSQYTRNPLGLLQQNGYTSDLQRVLLATLNIKQRLDFWVPGLSANILFSYDGSGVYSTGIAQQYTVSDTTKSYLTASPVAYRSSGYSGNNLQNEYWVGLDYDKSFGLHSINASVRAQRFADKQPERLDVKNQGLSGRVEYAYNQRYFLSLVAGYSGSENIAPSKRYGLFPAVSAGWVISEESFLKNNKLFSYLKLRGSYGTVGNDEIGGSRFAFESFYNRNATGGGYAFGSSFSATSSSTETNLGNPDLTWETVKMVNVGFDMHFFNNSLGITADFYHTRREGILTVNTLPSFLGQDVGLVNAGIVDAGGMDASAFYNKRIGKLDISVNGNILVSKNKVIAQNGQVGLPAYQSTIGKIAGAYLVFVSDGLFQNQAEIDRSATQTLSGKVGPGDIKYRDVGGITGVPDGIIDNNDRVRINKTDNPNTYFGFGTGLKYGIFDVSAQFQGVLGSTINIQGVVNSGPFYFNEESLSRWTPATAATAKYPRLGLADRGNNTAFSDFWQRSGDFIRLKSVEAGISLPGKLITRYKMSGFRLFVGGYNLFSSNSLDLNIDPEIPGAGRAGNYPYLKTWTIGLSAKF